MKVMDKIKDLKTRKAEKKVIQGIIRNTLDSKGWGIIERDAKNSLREKYQQLVEVDAKDLKKAQIEIKLAIDFIENIYSLAGLVWEWDGYKEIKEPVENDPAKSKEDDLLQAHLLKLREVA